MQPGPRVEMAERFVLADRSHQYSLAIREPREQEAGTYICVVFNKGEARHLEAGGCHLYPLYPDTPLTHAAARVRVLPRPPAPPPARARQLPALTTALAVLGSTALLLLLVLLGLLCRHRSRTKLGEVQYIYSCHI